MTDHLLRAFRPDDAAAICGLHARHAVADVVDVHPTVEPLLDPDGVRRAMRAADWAVVAVDAAGSLVGWGSLRSWTEDDGTRVYLSDGYAAPPARGRIADRVVGFVAASRGPPIPQSAHPLTTRIQSAVQDAFPPSSAVRRCGFGRR